MRSKKLAALAAVSLMTASTAASAQSSQWFSDSSTAVRSAESTEDASALGGGWIIPALVVVALIVGAVVLSDGSDSP